MSEVTDALRELQAGTRTIEDVAAMFAARSWPKPPAKTPDNAMDAFKAEQSDRDPEPDGSWAEVAQAFYDGIISLEEYEALAEAKASASPAPETPEQPEPAEDEEPDEPEDEEPAEEEESEP